jgi:hypothetical protein
LVAGVAFYGPFAGLLDGSERGRDPGALLFHQGERTGRLADFRHALRRGQFCRQKLLGLKQQ